MCLKQFVAGFGEYFPHIAPLRMADLDRDSPTVFQMYRRVHGYCPVWIEAIGSPIKRTARIMEPYFSL
jgi:hypothetical protein